MDNSQDINNELKSQEINLQESNSQKLNSPEINELNSKYNEWNTLIDNSNTRYNIHSNAAILWNTINHILNLSLIILSSIITADGIGDIFSKDILIILGLIMMALSSMNTFLNPSSKYTKHRDISKKYRLVYHQTKRCNNFANFLELTTQFEDIEQETPDVPIFLNKKNMRILFMNPNLQSDFDNYYRYQNKPQQIIVNTYAAKVQPK